MKEDRFLIGIIIVVALLVVASLLVFFLQRGEITYLPEDTPDGVVHNYILAVQQGDFEKAYGYLANGDKKYKPTYDEFLNHYFLDNNDGESIQIGETEVGEHTATVEIVVIENNDLFSNPSRYSRNALLFKQNGIWKIRQMSYGWNRSWYEKGN